MKSITSKVFVCLFGLIFSDAFQLYAQKQEICGFDRYVNQTLKSLNITRAEYERMLNKQIESVHARIRNGERTLDDRTYRVPIIFHIIHPPEAAIGTSTNPTDEDIKAQLALVNRDLFGNDGNRNDRGRVPREFKDVEGGNAKIILELAKRDTLGLPTTGILRSEANPDSDDLEEYRGSVIAYIFNEISKPWGQAHYMNIYVIAGDVLKADENFSTVLGIAPLPLSTIDGLVAKNFFNPVPSRGGYSSWAAVRTSVFIGTNVVTFTHEIGHAFGLFHTFQPAFATFDQSLDGQRRGDPCDRNFNDFCEDTPVADASRRPLGSSCSLTTCGTPDMPQNYMDYSADECQVMFTKCQVARMRAVLELSPARMHLGTNPDEEPDSENATKIQLKELPDYQNNVEIGFDSSIPDNREHCSERVHRRIRIINHSINPIESVEVEFQVNDIHLKDTLYEFTGELMQTFNEGPIPSYRDIGNNSTDYENSLSETFAEAGEDPVTYPEPNYHVPYRFVEYGPFSIEDVIGDDTGEYSFSIIVKQVNGSPQDEPPTDGISRENDTISYILYKIPVEARTPPSFPYVEDFKDESDLWGSFEPFQEDEDKALKIVSNRDNTNKMLAFNTYELEDQHRRIRMFSDNVDLRSIGDDKQAIFSLRYAHSIDATRYNGLFLIAHKGITQEDLNAGGCIADSSRFQTEYADYEGDLIVGVEKKANELPLYESDWRTIEIILPKEEVIQSYALLYNSGTSVGNLYIDDLTIDAVPIAPNKQESIRFYDVVIPPMSCAENNHLFFANYANYGAEPIELRNIWARYRRNDSSPSSWESLDIREGGAWDPRYRDDDITNEELPAHTTSFLFLYVPIRSITGLSKVTFELTVNSDEPDEDIEILDHQRISSNIYTSNLSITERRFPFVDDGEEVTRSWKGATTFDNPDLEWQRTTSKSGNYLLRAPLYDRAKTDAQPFFRLMSPEIDLRDATEQVNFSFQLSYAPRAGAVNRLRLFVFENCTPNPAAIIFDKADSELATTEASDTPWFPLQTSDWRQESVDLSDYLGNRVHLLFVAYSESGAGNNIYLDNLSVQSGDNPELPPLPEPSGGEGEPEETSTALNEGERVRIYPNPGLAEELKLAFNLSKRQDVKVSFVDSSGKLAWSRTLEKVQSNTEALKPNLGGNQVYVVRVEFGDDDVENFRYIME